MIKRHTKPTQKTPAGRHHRQGGHDPHLERARCYDDKLGRAAPAPKYAVEDGDARSASA